MSEPVDIEVYYDYGCPYVYRAAMWLRDIQAARPDLRVHWRSFPLEQVNSAEGPAWKLWEQSDEFRSRGLPAFRGALAAREQGEAQFIAFHNALLAARHADGKDLGKRETLLGAADAAQLDRERFARDLANRDLLEAIGRDYQHGRNELGVFGMPTFVFPNGGAAYLKLNDVPSGEAALSLWDEFRDTVAARPVIEEIKRPRKPRE